MRGLLIGRWILCLSFIDFGTLVSFEFRMAINMNERMASTGLCFFCVIVSSACGGSTSKTSAASAPENEIDARVIFASAPMGMDATDLGRPFDENFRSVGVPSLFESIDTSPKAVNAFDHRFTVIESSEELLANANGWGVASVEAGVAEQTRYASYRAYQVEYTRELGDETLRTTAPTDARYYARKIYYGHLYEFVVSGSTSKMHAKMDVSFPVFGGGLEATTRGMQLESRIRGIGMRPKSGDAIFETSPEGIAKAYATDGPPVPIFVEYRRLPDRVVASKSYKWQQPRYVTVKLKDIYLYRDGVNGTTTWKLNVSCRVNGVAAFKTQLWEKQNVDANGLTGGSHGRGPSNRLYESYNRENLNWQYMFALREGDVLECGVDGNDASERGYLIPAGSFEYRVGDPTKDEDIFGNYNAKVEYAVSYSLQLSGISETKITALHEMVEKACLCKTRSCIEASKENASDLASDEFYARLVEEERAVVTTIASRMITCTAALEFAAQPAFRVDSIVPRSGPADGGQSVAIHGSGFSAAGKLGMKVYFGDKMARFLRFEGSDEIHVVPPPGVPGQTVDVQVIVGDGREQKLVAGYTYAVQ